MSDKTFDILAAIGRLILPALGTLYFALAQIWGWPYGEAIVGSLAAVTAFLNVVLKIKSDTWWKDKEVVEHE